MNIKYILLSLVVLLTACSSDNDIFNVENTHKAQLTISTEIVTTRAFDTGLKNDVEFKEGNDIGVWLVERKNTYDNALLHNRKATYNSNTWIFDSIPVLDKKKIKVYACYPYVAKFDTIEWITRPTNTYSIISKQYNVPIDISSFAHGDGQQDYLWGEADSVNCDKSHADVSFKHVLPRITFNLTNGSEDINDNVYIRRAILANATKGSAICTKGYMDILTGNVYKGNSQNGRFYVMLYDNISVSDSIVQAVYNTLDSKTVQELNYLVLPTEFKDGEVVLRLEISRVATGNYQLYEIPIPASTWESGKHYTYPVTLSIHEKLNPESEDVGTKVYMGFNGDNGKPLYWSSWNLGASKPENYGGLYGWGDPTGEHKEHFYEYKKNDPYYMTDTLKCLTYYGGDSPIYNISGTRYDVARTLWGGAWRTPTSSEFNKLRINCTYEWTTQNNVEGFKFTSKVNGNTIFLPHSPIRYGNYLYWSEWNTVNNRYYKGSDYWTANINTSERNSATMFVFSNSNSCWNAWGNKRYAGLPIRPVTEY